eukprot:Plantae.Rhodophyta-Hildenbrandia_rubra.ctg1389.p1 GENE.Plantae.Rhodophyta-Hildenbrandia_rubra.ctg1389~~Plantae.Rhodophyta-Hildenbrandia_rubra.ctg1389.p1  ORF type:complete len:854 (-),score=202.65 Plantae.Rhodophyta-Hildenbrandia_rubra.ctg1389:8117-10678(-)
MGGRHSKDNYDRDKEEVVQGGRRRVVGDVGGRKRERKEIDQRDEYGDGYGDGERVEFAKRVIEVYYDELFSRVEERERERVALERDVRDGFVSEKSKRLRLHEQFVKELEYVRKRRRPIKVDDFQVLEKIGHGSYGTVYLVRQNDTGELFAMKKLNKETMVSRRQVAHVWLERFVLATTGECPYVVKMYYSLQDRENLYFLMEFLAGGDLLGMLTREKTVSENCARFYIAEIIVAIDSLHRTGIIHRDVKCDNIIFDASGHIRLSDFGLSKSLLLHLGKRLASNTKGGRDVLAQPPGLSGNHGRRSFSHSRRFRAGMANMSVAQRARAWKAMAREEVFSAVGTPNYIAPEVLTDSAYTESCDWWSVGCILFEMLVGYPPFWSQSPQTTMKMIANWDQYFVIPNLPESRLGKDAKDLIRRLLCDDAHRLGAKNGLEEFKEHPFFEGVAWDNLLDMQPPFVPELSSPKDTRYFDVKDKTRISKSVPLSRGSFNVSTDWLRGMYDAPLSAMKHVRNVKKMRRVLNTDLDFVGFSFTRQRSRDHKTLVDVVSVVGPQTPESPKAVQEIEPAVGPKASSGTTSPLGLREREDMNASMIDLESAAEVANSLDTSTKNADKLVEDVRWPSKASGEADAQHVTPAELERELEGVINSKTLSPLTLTDLSEDGEDEQEQYYNKLGTGAAKILLDESGITSGNLGPVFEDNGVVKRASVSPVVLQRRKSSRLRMSRDLRKSVEVDTLDHPSRVDDALIEMDVAIPSTSELSTFVNTAEKEINAAASVLDVSAADQDEVARTAKLGINDTAAELTASIAAEHIKPTIVSSSSEIDESNIASLTSGLQDCALNVEPNAEARETKD